jgi:hypothetical protein
MKPLLNSHPEFVPDSWRFAAWQQGQETPYMDGEFQVMGLITGVGGIVRVLIKPLIVMSGN